MLSKEQSEWFRNKLSELENEMGVDDTTGETGTLKELALAREQNIKSKSPIESILNTALAINWKWTIAKPRIDRFLREFPEINSLEKLDRTLARLDARTFAKKYLNIKVNTKKPDVNPKYQMLKSLCSAFLNYQRVHKLQTETEALHHWAKQVDLSDLKHDSIGGITGVGPAAVQNLRLCLGYNVAKPDRHVERVLAQLFCLKIRWYQFPELANDVGLSELYLDKVLYEYGRNKENL